MKLKINKTTIEIGSFKFINDKKEIKIVSKSGDWMQVFRFNTREYYIMNMLINDNNTGELEIFAQTLFMTRLIFQDVELIGGFMGAIEDSKNRLIAAQNAEEQTQSDEEILAEQKVLHEKTEESVSELIKIKKNE